LVYNKNMANTNYSKFKKEIEEIYKDYLVKLTYLNKKQDKLINDFIKALESKKIEVIKENIRTNKKM